MGKNREQMVAAEVKKNQAEIDDYLSSVQGLYAFAASACWDDEERRIRPESKRCIPRTMTCIVKKKSRNLTPDGIIQTTGEYGVVAEMKKHFRGATLKPFAQIAKYDQDLVGWWTENEKLENHDLVLLTHYLSSTRAQDAYKLWVNKNGEFDRKFAIVEFTFTTQAQSYFALRRVAGQLSDADHDERLRQGNPIPESVFIGITTKYKFYDTPPPLIYMLHLLQDHIFPTLFSEEQYDEETGGTHPQVVVTVRKVRRLLEEQFCDSRHSTREPKLPEASWVREALDAFVDMGLATKHGGRQKRYTVILKKPYRKNPIEYFTRKLMAATEKKGAAKRPHPHQQQLFEKPTQNAAK